MTEACQEIAVAPKVLIADDDPSIVKFLADRCARAGFEVRTAANGLQAVMMMRRSPPHVAIMDVNMPEVDGLTACLRMLDPDSGPLDVIVMTGRPSTEVTERCEGFGTFYVEKGPDFWTNMQSALAEIFPDMGERLSPPGVPDCEVRKRPVVLVVDDDPDIERFLSSRLRKLGLDTVAASDARQGYRMACREKPSVIVSDYYMPNGDAHYLLSKLRATPETQSIPVLVVTGRTLDMQAVQSIRHEVCGKPGAVRVFKKAYDARELVAAIQRYCN